MKSKITKKLILNKETVSNLESVEMGKVKGGTRDTNYFQCTHPAMTCTPT